MYSLFINKDILGEYIMRFVMYIFLKSPKYWRIIVASSMTSDTYQLLTNHMASHRRRPLASHTPASKLQGLVSINIFL